ncbi:hypothetical protein ACQKGC_25590 [Allorhizobium pseudoryzae]|uniref:hypothetical protein n=1 Tax=Allorhizobium pseudoryzae TaxID=379684 RepID=UPI003D02855E
MTSPIRPIDKLIALCAEAARQFGDDPSAIADFVDAGIKELPKPEQRQLREQLALLTDQSQSQRSPS